MQPTVRFADVEIRILPKQSDGHPVEIIVNGEQEFAGGVLQPQPWVASASAANDGRRLAEWLFADTRTQAAWNQIRGQHPRRRLRLRITADAPELHQVPWELLTDLDDAAPGTVLAAATATPFSRYLAGQWRPGSPILQRPVKVLVAMANPPTDLADEYGLQPVEIEQEMTRLQALTESLEVELVQLPQPCTLGAIEETLRGGIHILHLIAHGQHRAASETRDEASVLFLANDDNQTELVHAGDFAAMLARQLSDADLANEEKLRLVFLASCETAKRSSAAAFRGFAPQLVQAGVPAVVAMQELVPVKTAGQFTQTFYTGLLRHGQVDLAANEARSAVLSAKLSGAAIPVLFMRLRSDQLLGARGRVIGDDADSFCQLLAPGW